MLPIYLFEASPVLKFTLLCIEENSLCLYHTRHTRLLSWYEAACAERKDCKEKGAASGCGCLLRAADRGGRRAQ